MRRRRRTAAGEVRRTWRRRFANNNTRLRAVNVRSLGDKLHQVAQFMAQHADELDSMDFDFSTVRDIERRIDDNIYTLKNELDVEFYD